MDYTQMTREQLLETVQELSVLNKELLAEKERETRLEFSWAGNLGHWYLNFVTGTVVFNPLKIAALGYLQDELPEKVKYKFFTDKLHPDDHDKTMDAMKANMSGQVPIYECEYRIQARDGSWKWFYDRGRVTQRDAAGNAVFAAGIVFDITEKKAAAENLEQMNEHFKNQALIDQLTGIRNRRAILENLAERVDQALDNRSPLSIALIDIDHFKTVNDTKGHPFGDQVLKDVAAALSGSIRGLDVVGRYGGEEFLAVFPNTELGNALMVSERMRKRVKSTSFADNYQVTISVGVVQLQSESIDELIAAADKRLYAAKEAGRDRVIGE